MRILTISSQVAFGPVGNSAAVPAMQALAHEVLAIPTVTLSNHPGHGKPSGFRTSFSDLAAMLLALERLGALHSCDAVMTGYFADEKQIAVVAETIARMRVNNPSLYVLVDPVIGDDHALYVPLSVAEAIRDRLLPLGSCVSPNCFELSWLTGMGITDIADARAAAARLPVKEVLATSVPAATGRIATLAIHGGECFERVTTLRGAAPHGTGDFLAGSYLAHRLAATPEAALGQAMAALEYAIDRSAGSSVLAVASR